MSNVKAGKRPLSQKQATFVTPDEVFGNPLKLDQELKNEIANKGLECRFIDAKRLYEMSGYHKNGWVPYRREKAEGFGITDFKFGSDPEGIIRRGSMILAVKPKDQAEKHRAYLRQKAGVYAQVNKTKADEMRQFAKERQVDTHVYEGFEENDHDKGELNG